MAETVAGGAYRDATGNGYHDANGKPVKSSVVAEAQEIQSEQSAIKTATMTPIPSQSSEALAAAVRSMLVAPATAQPDNDKGKK